MFHSVPDSLGCVAALALLSCSALAQADLPAYADLRTVAAAPMPAVSGTPLQPVLAAYARHPILVNFWASWCEPCREELPALLRVQQRFASRGLKVVTVAVADNQRESRALVESLAPGLTVIQDADQVLSRAWGATMLPMSVVLDHRHRSILRAKGAVKWDAPETAGVLERAISKEGSQ